MILEMGASAKPVMKQHVFEIRRKRVSTTLEIDWPELCSNVIVDSL
jgi:hypothetical protein